MTQQVVVKCTYEGELRRFSVGADAAEETVLAQVLSLFRLSPHAVHVRFSTGTSSQWVRVLH